MNRSTSLARAIALMVVAAAPHASADERKPRRVDADSLATQAANQTIDAGLSSLRDSGVPFLGALQGVNMELDDCAFPLLKGIVPTANLDEGFRGVNWALLAT